VTNDNGTVVNIGIEPLDKGVDCHLRGFLAYELVIREAVDCNGGGVVHLRHRQAMESSTRTIAPQRDSGDLDNLGHSRVAMSRLEIKDDVPSHFTFAI